MRLIMKLKIFMIYTECFEDEDKWEEFKQWVFYQYRGLIYHVKEDTFKNVHESNNERRICAYSYWLFYHKYEHCLGRKLPKLAY